MRLPLVILALSVGCMAQSTDLFLMPGSDFTRPGTRVNLNVGAGHTLSSLKGSWVGDELTFAYTYENAGSHGFWHQPQGSHTESAGVMRNWSLGKSPFGVYSWLQAGATELTGQGARVEFYSGESVGLAWHLSKHSGVWAQESFNKVVSVPWYTSTNVGYVWSF